MPKKQRKSKVMTSDRLNEKLLYIADKLEWLGTESAKAKLSDIDNEATKRIDRAIGSIEDGHYPMVVKKGRIGEWVQMPNGDKIYIIPDYSKSDKK